MPNVYVHPSGDLTKLVDEVTALRADLATLKANFDGHTHGATVAAQAASPALTSNGIVRK